jgi:hypothetical protein
MIALRFVTGLAVAVWLGGVVAIGGVFAPSAFAVLPTSQAGAVVGETLRRFHLVSYAAGAVLLGALALMAVLGPRPRPFGLRIAIVVVMLGSSLVSGLWVDRRLAALRTDIGVPVRSLPVGDTRRATFGRLHGLSTLLLAISAAGGLALLFLDTRTLR